MQQNLANRILWHGSGSHPLDGEKTAADRHDELAGTGGDGGAAVGIDIQTVTDDRRVTDPSRHLPGHAAGRTGTSHESTLVQTQHTDRVVVVSPTFLVITEERAIRIAIDRSDIRRTTLLLGLPLLPGILRILREQWLFRQAMRVRKVIRALAGEHDVGRQVHDQTGDLDRMPMRSNGTDTPHCSGDVMRQPSRLIWPSRSGNPVPHRVDAGIVVAENGDRLHGVHG